MEKEQQEEKRERGRIVKKEKKGETDVYKMFSSHKFTSINHTR